MKKYIKIYKLIFSLLTVIGSQATYAQFVRGADIGWLSQMEQSGRVWKDSLGVQRDLLDILDDYCVNTIRLRVWVNPAGGWCGKQDVVNMAKRAVAKGYRILIDFHYSDSWADPGQQTKPSAWANYSVSQLSQAINDHTVDVLDALKAQNVVPEWVQVGNETNDGMLWPEGKASTNMANYAKFVLSGYNAVKSVFPNAKVIVHLSNGYDNSLYKWNIGGLLNNGAKIDVIGMSYYPTNASDWQTYSGQALSNMQDMVSRYSKEVIVSEIGISVSNPNEARQFVERTIQNLQSLSGNKGIGVLWWEPEAYDWQGYDKVAWSYATKQPTDAMEGFKYGCQTIGAPKVVVTAPAQNTIYTAPANVLVTATATPSSSSNIISKVEFYEGSKKIGEDLSSPFSLNWSNIPPGTYSLSAIATESNGKVGSSNSIAIIVKVDPSDSTNVTFRLNATGVSTTNGVFITGSFTGSPNWSIIPMVSQGNNIYTYSHKFAMKDTGAYYYLNGSSWTSRETVPIACAAMYDSDRKYIVSLLNQVIDDKWATCATVTDIVGTSLQGEEGADLYYDMTLGGYMFYADQEIDLIVYDIQGRNVRHKRTKGLYLVGEGLASGAYIVCWNWNSIKKSKIFIK